MNIYISFKKIVCVLLVAFLLVAVISFAEDAFWVTADGQAHLNFGLLFKMKIKKDNASTTSLTDYTLKEIERNVLAHLCPVGSVLPFAGKRSQVPDGWLLCDGSSISKTGLYADLFDVIGTVYGSSGDTFKLPDLQGKFMRGVVDANTHSFYAVYNENRTNMYQSAAVGIHQHSGILIPAYASSISGPTVNGLCLGNVENNSKFNTRFNYTEAYTGDGGSVITGDRYATESRPSNIGINFIIKY